MLLFFSHYVYTFINAASGPEGDAGDAAFWNDEAEIVLVWEIIERLLDSLPEQFSAVGPGWSVQAKGGWRGF